MTTMRSARFQHPGRVIVVGAGIVGASVAHHLAREGHEVIVLDMGEPAAAVTAASFAWVGVAKSSPESQMTALRSNAFKQFTNMLSELQGPIGYRPFGALSWESSDEATLTFIEQHRAAANPMKYLTSAEAIALEPNLKNAPPAVAHAPSDGGVDPVLLTKALLRSAKRHGAIVRPHTRVIGLLTTDNRVHGVLTDAGQFTASSVVLAAGTGAPGLAATAGAAVSLDDAPCCLIRFSVQKPLLRGILSTPDLEVRQLNDTTLIAAEDVPSGFDGDPLLLASPTLDAIRSSFVSSEQVHLESAVIANRPMTSDGLPNVGPVAGVPGLYSAVAHPAIILSAAIGRRVAADHRATMSP